MPNNADKLNEMGEVVNAERTQANIMIYFRLKTANLTEKANVQVPEKDAM